MPQYTPWLIIIIILILADLDFQQIMTVRVLSEHFNTNDVEVYLEWIPENILFTYHVDINPQPSSIMNLNKNSVCLRVKYNISYNVSITKVSRCGQNITISYNETLYYGECHTIRHNNYTHEWWRFVLFNLNAT